jgi:hypothetical protein
VTLSHWWPVGLSLTSVQFLQSRYSTRNLEFSLEIGLPGTKQFPSVTQTQAGDRGSLKVRKLAALGRQMWENQDQLCQKLARSNLKSKLGVVVGHCYNPRNFRLDPRTNMAKASSVQKV